MTTPEPGEQPPGPPISLGVLMFLPYRHMEQRVLAAVVAAGHPISLAQARLFQRVDHQGSRLTQLAEAAQVTKQTAGFLVDQLEHGGYVTRSPDASDGHARLVRITSRVYQVIEIAGREQARVGAEWAAHLGARDYERLQQSLVRLREITDPFV